MATNSKIEWTATRHEDGTVTPGATWNPVAGCERVSPGCANCYAVPLVYRMGHNPNAKIQAANIGLVEKQENGKLNWTGDIRTLPDRLTIPLHWKEPRRVFVNSLSDLFHKDVPFDFIDKVFAVMALCPQHTFQVLTKRPERMAEYLGNDLRADYITEEVFRIEPDAWVKYRRQIFDPKFDDCGKLDRCEVWYPLPNVWLGTSVENEEVSEQRIPHLLHCPAAVRFLSCEPLLGPVGISRWLDTHPLRDMPRNFGVNASAVPPCPIHWVIAGGESGSNARPMHPDWARSLRDQCQAAGVAFFFKQWGCYAPSEQVEAQNEVEISFHGKTCGWRNNYQGCGVGRTSDLDEPTAWMGYVGKKSAGRLLDGREWNEMPEVSRAR